jgi:hypothetical protein
MFARVRECFQIQVVRSRREAEGEGLGGERGREGRGGRDLRSLSIV